MSTRAAEIKIMVDHSIALTLIKHNLFFEFQKAKD